MYMCYIQFNYGKFGRRVRVAVLLGTRLTYNESRCRVFIQYHVRCDWWNALIIDTFVRHACHAMFWLNSTLPRYIVVAWWHVTHPFYFRTLANLIGLKRTIMTQPPEFILISTRPLDRDRQAFQMRCRPGIFVQIFFPPDSADRSGRDC
jgi:hypothetical protein